MSFYAQNDRIYLKDTNGEVTFDTNFNMPCVVSVHEFEFTQFCNNPSSIDYEWDLGNLPDYPDFVMVRAQCNPRGRRLYWPLEAKKTGQTKVDTWAEGEGGLNRFLNNFYKFGTVERWSPWMVCTPRGGSMFFQGSAILEIGSKGGTNGVGQYAVRALHVYVEKDWGNKLICRLQQSIMFGEYLNDTTWPYAGLLNETESVEWNVKLKIWCGKFRQ